MLFEIRAESLRVRLYELRKDLFTRVGKKRRKLSIWNLVLTSGTDTRFGRRRIDICVKISESYKKQRVWLFITLLIRKLTLKKILTLSGLKLNFPRIENWSAIDKCMMSRSRRRYKQMLKKFSSDWRSVLLKYSYRDEDKKNESFEKLSHTRSGK